MRLDSVKWFQYVWTVNWFVYSPTETSSTSWSLFDKTIWLPTSERLHAAYENKVVIRTEESDGVLEIRVFFCWPDKTSTDHYHLFYFHVKKENQLSHKLTASHACDVLTLLWLKRGTHCGKKDTDCIDANLQSCSTEFVIPNGGGFGTGGGRGGLKKMKLKKMAHMHRDGKRIAACAAHAL